MLVLSRREGETLVFTHPDGTVIRVGIGDIQKGRVRLVVDAPRCVGVAREELLAVVKSQPEPEVAR